MTRLYFPVKPWHRTQRMALGRASTIVAVRSWHYDGEAFRALQGLAALLRAMA